MSQKEFVLRMTIAYMQHYGIQPNFANIEEWKRLFVEM